MITDRIHITQTRKLTCLLLPSSFLSWTSCSSCFLFWLYQPSFLKERLSTTSLSPAQPFFSQFEQRCVNKVSFFISSWHIDSVVGLSIGSPSPPDNNNNNSCDYDNKEDTSKSNQQSPQWVTWPRAVSSR